MVQASSQILPSSARLGWNRTLATIAVAAGGSNSRIRGASGVRFVRRAFLARVQTRTGCGRALFRFRRLQESRGLPVLPNGGRAGLAVATRDRNQEEDQKDSIFRHSGGCLDLGRSEGDKSSGQRIMTYPSKFTGRRLMGLGSN